MALPAFKAVCVPPKGQVGSTPMYSRNDPALAGFFDLKKNLSVYHLLARIQSFILRFCLPDLLARRPAWRFNSLMVGYFQRRDYSF